MIYEVLLDFKKIFTSITILFHEMILKCRFISGEFHENV